MSLQGQLIHIFCVHQAVQLTAAMTGTRTVVLLWKNQCKFFRLWWLKSVGIELHNEPQRVFSQDHFCWSCEQLDLTRTRKFSVRLGPRAVLLPGSCLLPGAMLLSFTQHFLCFCYIVGASLYGMSFLVIEVFVVWEMSTWPTSRDVQLTHYSYSSIICLLMLGWWGAVAYPKQHDAKGWGAPWTRCQVNNIVTCQTIQTYIFHNEGPQATHIDKLCIVRIPRCRTA